MCIDTILNNCNTSNLCHCVHYLCKSSMNKSNSTNSCTDPPTGGFPLSQELDMFCSPPSSMFKQIVYPFNDLSFYSNSNEVEWWNSEGKLKKIYILGKTAWGKNRKKSQERRKLFKLPVCLISLEHVKQKNLPLAKLLVSNSVQLGIKCYCFEDVERNWVQERTNYFLWRLSSSVLADREGRKLQRIDE